MLPAGETSPIFRQQRACAGPLPDICSRRAGFACSTACEALFTWARRVFRA